MAERVKVPIENFYAPFNRWYDLKASPTPEGGMAVFCRDITDRRRAEEQVRDPAAELREAQRVAHVGSLYRDARTDASTGSDELYRIYGFDPTKEPFPAFREQDGRLYPHESWQRINQAVQRTLEPGVGYELDVPAFRGGEPI